MASFNVRTLEAADWPSLETVAGIEREAFGHEGLPAANLALLSHVGKIFVLMEDAVITGEAIVIGGLGEPRALLFSLAIAAAHRGQGRGRILMDHLSEALPRLGVKTLELTVSPDNGPALALYLDRLGFQKAGYLENHFGPGHHRFLLRKTL